MILVFSAIVLCFMLRAMGVGRELLAVLLPGEPERTAEAVGTLVENLHNGEAVNQAFLEFCGEIIEGGRMS